MVKFIVLSMLLSTTPALADEYCNDIKWSNMGILRAALEYRREELKTVKYLMVDTKKLQVGYVLEEGTVTKRFSYKICNEQIEFGPTM